MTKENVNYTDEMVATLREGYDPSADQETRDAQVRALAEDVGRSTRSVIAKLSRMKVYIPKEYKTKQGAKPVSKAALVAEIATLTGASEDVIGSLEKATKNALNVIVDALAPTA